MKNRKILSLFLVLLLVCTFFVACTKNNGEVAPVNKANNNSKDVSANKSDSREKVDVNIAALKGPTAMGMVGIFNSQDKSEGADNYNYKILSSPEEAVAALSAGEVDILSLPSNLAATLYNKTNGKIKVAAINTLGVLYIASQQDLKEIAELKGKTIVTSGKGAVPEFVLRYILEKNGIKPDSDVTIEYKSEHGEVLQAISADPQLIAMMPEPFLSVAMTKNENIKINFSMTDLWKDTMGEVGEDSQLIMGLVVVTNKFLEENPQAVEDFIKSYESSINFVNNNVEEAAKLVGQYDIVPAPVAAKAIPKCNIVFIKGEEMKKSLSGFLKVLFEQNPASVGGQLPNEDFYITK